MRASSTPQPRPPDAGPRPPREEAATARSGRPLSWRFELALVAAAWLLYFGIRALTEGSHAAAVAHANRVLDVERALGIAWEDDVQALITDHRWLLDLANWVYIWGHWPVIACTAVWLFARHQQAYRHLRDAMFVSGAIGLAIFALVPVAPPRLADLGLLDTVTTYSTSYRALQPPALTNVYAAMPSLHFGWDLLVGIVIATQARHLALRLFGIVMPFLMAMAVVATANHFVLDVVAGGALALVGLLAARRLAPLSPPEPPAEERRNTDECSSPAPGVGSLR